MTTYVERAPSGVWVESDVPLPARRGVLATLLATWHYELTKANKATDSRPSDPATWAR